MSRYYNKYNISKKLDRFHKCMSERELFLSDHTEYISLQTIQDKKVQVLSFDEYERINRIEEHMYFLSLKPDPSEWVKQCVCDTPMNPDFDYIQCDSCEKWFHYKCVFISQAQADNMDRYYCSKCSAKPVHTLPATNGTQH